MSVEMQERRENVVKLFVSIIDNGLIIESTLLLTIDEIMDSFLEDSGENLGQSSILTLVSNERDTS